MFTKLWKIDKFVIRFWEKEFALNSGRSNGGQRFYEEKDFETFQQIKTLLYDQKFTIAGAKKQLIDLNLNSDTNNNIIASQKTNIKNQDYNNLNKQKYNFYRLLKHKKYVNVGF